jgi:hypothetical protein
LNRLGLLYVLAGVDDKKSALLQISGALNIDLSKTIYIGDDIPDLEVIQVCGIPCCPQDAAAEIASSGAPSASIWVGVDGAGELLAADGLGEHRKGLGGSGLIPGFIPSVVSDVNTLAVTPGASGRLTLGAAIPAANTLTSPSMARAVTTSIPGTRPTNPCLTSDSSVSDGKNSTADSAAAAMGSRIGKSTLAPAPPWAMPSWWW